MGGWVYVPNNTVSSSYIYCMDIKLYIGQLTRPEMNIWRKKLYFHKLQFKAILCKKNRSQSLCGGDIRIAPVSYSIIL